jgi:adenylate kinase family enzyme
MKITIIGPLCSGKSTLGADLSKKLKGSIFLEEAYRIFHSQGIDVPISENKTQESCLKLFDYSYSRMSELQEDKDYIILGSPFDEYMYAVNSMKTSLTTDLDSEFLHSLRTRVRSAMQEFDIILKVENFQDIKVNQSSLIHI